ncbi:MAG: sensor histidine kinase [Planctomycetota bacterium]
MQVPSPGPLSVRSVLWLCTLRWGAVGLLVTFGAVALLAPRLETFGVELRADWPLVMAGILAVANLLFVRHARAQREADGRRMLTINVWCQMITDLVAHTFAVHFLGSLETYFAFVYLFHIVISCVLFSRRQSLVIALLACCLYVSTIGLEAARVAGSSSVYSTAALGRHAARRTWPSAFNAMSAMSIWMVVWYMASHLSALVREQSVELAATNRRLVAAQEERARHLLRTTHELKAPFAAICANAQLLLKGHCGDMSEDAEEVLGRVVARCRHLTREIQEMLQLANLRSAARSSDETEAVDLEDVVKDGVDRVRAVAEERRIAIEEHLAPARTDCVREHLDMVMDNLLTNAVNYSHEGGHVLVECGTSSGGEAGITVSDEGIGIPAKKLSRVFEEHYRTGEAASFNMSSTGLGLAIVKHIAELHGIRLRLESTHGKGTSVFLRFAPRASVDGSVVERREDGDGIRDDSR